MALALVASADDADLAERDTVSHASVQTPLDKSPVAELSDDDLRGRVMGHVPLALLPSHNS